MRALLFGCAAVFVGNSCAIAAPPQDCAWKFVGTWQSTFTPNGHQSTATIKADGTQAVSCAGGGCVSSLNWTCSGDTHIVGSARSKLSPDGKRMTWRLGYSVRLTPVPAGLVGGGKQPPVIKKNDPSAGRASNPENCIDEKKKRNGAYYDYRFKNICRARVSFNYDDCDNVGTKIPSCSVKQMSLGGGQSISGSTYRNPPNPRNFR